MLSTRHLYNLGHPRALINLLRYYYVIIPEIILYINLNKAVNFYSKNFHIIGAVDFGADLRQGG